MYTVVVISLKDFCMVANVIGLKVCEFSFPGVYINQACDKIYGEKSIPMIALW